MKRSSNGFSLIEIMGVVVLLALLVSSFVYTQRKTVPKAPARAVAESLGQLLRSAQSTAKAEGTCVAVVFPTDGGQTQIYQSYYLLKGMKEPEMVIARNTGSESDGVYWTTAHDPTATGLTLDQPDNSQGLSFERWSPPYPEDNHIIFLPTGEVTSNGLPLYNGQFRLVVAEGFVTTSGSPPGTAPVSWSASLAALESKPVCSTVSISTSGEISVHDQLPDSALPTLRAEDIPTVTVAALPPYPNEPAPNIDIVGALELNPDPNENSDFLPDGSTALVPEGEHLQVTVRGTSNRGFPLFCSWESTVLDGGPNNVSEPGAFSSPNREPMKWNAEEEIWESSWSWAPPANSAGADYNLVCTIVDSEDHQFGGDQRAMAIRATVSSDPFRLGVVSDRVTDTNRAGERRAYLMRGDGTDLKEIGGTPERADWVAVSPNSQYLVREATIGTNRTAMIITRRDGSARTRVTGTPANGSDYFPQWSPGGNYVVFVRRQTASFRTAEIWRANLSDRVGDTIDPVRMLHDPITNHWFTEPSLSQTALPNGNFRMVATYAREGSGLGSDIMLYELTSQGVIVDQRFVTLWGTGTSFPWFHPLDPNIVAFKSNRRQPGYPRQGFFQANLADNPLTGAPYPPNGTGHVARLSGRVRAFGIGKFDGVGNFHFQSTGRSLFRKVPGNPDPELRVGGGLAGFHVNKVGDVFLNRDFGGGNIEILRLNADSGPNEWLRLTTNAGFDSVYTGVKLLLP